ncbi:hypothetical protein CVT24_003289, partial [Panaeolus cyanescens]
MSERGMGVLPSVFDDEEVDEDKNATKDINKVSVVDKSTNKDDQDPDSPLIPRATFHLTVDEVDRRRKSVDLTSLGASFNQAFAESSPSSLSTLSPSSTKPTLAAKAGGLRISTSSSSTSSSGFDFPRASPRTPTSASTTFSTSASTSIPTTTDPSSSSSSLHPHSQYPQYASYTSYLYGNERRASPISEASEGSIRSGGSGKEKTATATGGNGKRVSSGSYFGLGHGGRASPSGGYGRSSPSGGYGRSSPSGGMGGYGRLSPNASPNGSPNIPSTPRSEEEDENELFPLPSPRRSPRGTPSPTPSL